MKLYVWNDPYQLKYGGAIAYAVAESEEQARELAQTAQRSKFGLTPERGGCDLGKRKPDRVLDLPCAEIYEWQE